MSARHQFTWPFKPSEVDLSDPRWLEPKAAAAKARRHVRTIRRLIADEDVSVMLGARRYIWYPRLIEALARLATPRHHSPSAKRDA